MPKSETYESAESVTTALETEDSSLSNFAFGTEQRQELNLKQMSKLQIIQFFTNVCSKPSKYDRYQSFLQK